MSTPMTVRAASLELQQATYELQVARLGLPALLAPYTLTRLPRLPQQRRRH